MTDFDWATAPAICELDGYRWVLGPEADKEMGWDDATEWCKPVGGVLPPKNILHHAFWNEYIKGQFSDGSYWSSSGCTDHFAWAQSFSDRCTKGLNKNIAQSVRAVKAIKIGEE
tara:strand:+ start:480 stop:821 length:342 start_codon:yes stop_codon:yes gene_type:complete